MPFVAWGMPKERVAYDRPRDVNQLTKRLVSICTGEEEDTISETPSAGAFKRGAARVAIVAPEIRKAIAKKVARTHWNKQTR